MEEFSYLDQIIEEKLIDKFMIYRKRQSRCDDEFIEKSISLSDLETFGFEGEELDYVMNYLKDRDIFVCGNSPALYSGFENYKNTTKLFTLRKSIEIDENEKFELLKKYKDNNDKVLRNRLIESYIGLVTYISSKYSDVTGIDVDELSSYGYEGLIRALDNFSLGRERFSTFAVHYIDGYILGGIPKILGFNRKKFYYDFINTKRKLESETGEKIDNYLERIDDIVNLLTENEKQAEEIKRRVFS